MRNGRYTLWIDPEHSYRIAKAEVMKRADDLYLREAVKHEYGDLPSGVRPAAASKRPKTREEFSVVLDDVKFDRIGDLWVPIEARISMVTRYDGGERTATCPKHIKRTRIDLDPDFLAINAFARDFPDGTRVFIEETPGTRYVWQGGKPVAVER